MTSTINTICDDYRIIRRKGAVVPFQPNRLEAAMTRALLAVGGSSKASKKSPSAGSVQDTGSATSAGADAGGSGGGDGDSDGDGGGDGDGPRRSRSRSRTPHASRTTRRSRQQLLSKPDPQHAHSRALNTFLVVTALLLGTALAFGLNGQVVLADKVLGTFVSVATVAAALLRPK